MPYTSFMSRRTLGVCYMFVATFLFAWMTVFVKMLDRIPAMEIVLFRSLIALVLCLYPLRRAGIPVLGTRRGLLVARGLAGAVSLGMNFWLVQQIPLATASTLTYLAPIFTMLIGIWFVGERVRPIQFLLFGLSFAGVVIVQGFDPRISPLHLGVGITTSLVMGIAYNCVRKLSGSEHALVIMLYFPLMTLPVAGLWSALNWVQPQGVEWLIILGVGLSAQMAQYCLTRSYQLAEIATVSIVNYSGIVFSILLGIVIFGEHFNLPTYAGMVLVLLGVVCNVLLKTRRPVLSSRTQTGETRTT